MDEKNPYIQGENLKRTIYPMPKEIEELLQQKKLIEAYKRRPDYQKNDYIGWITRARREETRMKRLDQMVAELEQGDRYMGMDYRE
ncbi:YdeI/OmpD-associated family protein [Listeria costaricensis]|uniref:YdeI/OmpD-associated family protein n=1 Tax=Listeria costaricensis TaxID=2026604 RepID=UPI000C088922|nr:YdeI/OmpD-associated family protein [Listeria costaricensis]